MKRILCSSVCAVSFLTWVFFSWNLRRAPMELWSKNVGNGCWKWLALGYVKDTLSMQSQPFESCFSIKATNFMQFKGLFGNYVRCKDGGILLVQPHPLGYTQTCFASAWLLPNTSSGEMQDSFYSDFNYSDFFRSWRFNLPVCIFPILYLSTSIRVYTYVNTIFISDEVNSFMKANSTKKNVKSLQCRKTISFCC